MRSAYGARKQSIKGGLVHRNAFNAHTFVQGPRVALGAHTGSTLPHPGRDLIRVAPPRLGAPPCAPLVVLLPFIQLRDGKTRKLSCLK